MGRFKSWLRPAVNTLYRLDWNEKLLENFSYPSNNIAFYGSEKE